VRNPVHSAPLIGAIALAVSASVPARAAETLSLTLAEALERADRNNPDVAAARAQVEAYTGRAESVRRSSWPRLGVGMSWTRSDNPAMAFMGKLNAGELTSEDFDVARLNSPAALSHLSSALTLEVPVDLARRVRSAADSLSGQALAAEAATREAVLDLRLRVAEAYRRATLARRALAVSGRALESARAREADVEARVGEGGALQADLLRVRSRRRQREADLAERRGDAELASSLLARLLGLEPSTVVEASEVAGAPPPLQGDEEAWLSRAQSRRPALDGAKQRLLSARASALGEKRAAWPELALMAQVQDDRNSPSEGQASGTIGAMLRWNLFDPARGKRVASAEAAARGAEHEARAALAQVRLEVESAWRRAQAARERYAAAAGGAEEGREALRVVQERRRAGMATLTDELETEAASVAAELDEIRAAAEAAIADSALSRAAGEL
jgi:outer membrane protein TolC